MDARHPYPPSRKGWFGVVLFVFLLTACGTQPAPPAAPTSPPTSPPTETPTPQPTPVPTPTVIPGPFESQPAIPYPSDEVVQGLGITAYQVVGEQYVALSEEGYVVAQAITNEKGEFTGWQRTVPFDVESGLVVPHPEEAKSKLINLEKSDSPIPQLVKALEMGGIEVRPEEILANITYEQRQYSVLDEQGKPVMKEYVFAVWNLPEELLPEKYKTLKGAIPLFWAKKEANGWQWQNTKEVPFRIFADALGIW